MGDFTLRDSGKIWEAEATMSGRTYLEDIRTELQSGRHQHRMGENLLRAFGYVRRRATAIQEISATLDALGLVADPPVNSEMPLKAPRIRFSLREESVAMQSVSVDSIDTSDRNTFNTQVEDEDETNVGLQEPAFSVSELASANTDVECIHSSASIKEAYTKMVLNKYSQMVVASNPKARQQDIKGIVSFKSMAKALMNGKPTTVGDCIDKEVSFAQSDTDLQSVINRLSEDDVVLVIGLDKRLQGIVTAWDLAEEFAGLVDPFKRMGEIEERLRALVKTRLGQGHVAQFLKEHRIWGDDPIAELEELTLGELQRVLEFPEHWDTLKLPFDRNVFIDALNEARNYRNRLMHFGEPLNEDEMRQLTNICDMVRQIPAR